jgi:hypothetical protein
VPSANAALRQYIRYDPVSQSARLDNALSYAGTMGAAEPAPAPATAEGGFVNPAFPDAAPAAPEPVANPLPTPGPLTPDTMDQPGGVSDDDFLNSFLGTTAAPADSAAAPSPDDDLLQQFLTEPPKAAGAGEQASTPSGTDTGSSVPFLDPISAFANGLIEAVPIVGPKVREFADYMDSLTYGENPEDRAAFNRRVQENQPLASGAGAVVGTVAPYLLAGSTMLGGKLLGNAGTLAQRIAMGGVSGATLEGLDEASRGGTPEEIAKRAMTGGLLGGGVGSFGGKLIARALGGAAIGGGMTAINGGTPEEIARNAGFGLAGGAGLHGIGKLGNKLLSGTPKAVAKIAQIARDKYGIQVGASQLSTNPLVRTVANAVDRVPFSGGTAAKAKQLSTFYRALANEIGENADALTPDVLAAARNRIGDVFESVATRVPVIKADPQFQNELVQAIADGESVLEAAKFPLIEKQFNNIVKTFGQGGEITGDQYLSLTAKNSILSKLIAQGGDVGDVAKEIKDALYGALERNAPADVAPDLAKARYQWKVLKTIENPAAKSPTGEISPALLMAPVIKNFGGKAYGNAGNMGELADIGQQFLKEPGTSNTAERGAAMIGLDKASHMLAPAAVAGGVAALANPGVLTGIAAHAPAMMMAPLVIRGIGEGMRSKTLANKLIANSLKTGPSTQASPGGIGLRSVLPLLSQQEPRKYLEITIPGPGNQNRLTAR